MQNPNYKSVRNDVIRTVDRNDQLCAKSNTFIISKSETNEKREEHQDLQKSECSNKNNSKHLVSEPKIDIRKSSSLYREHIFQTLPNDSNTEQPINKSVTNITNQFENKDADTNNDDIVIFERKEYICPKARTENVESNAKSKSVKVQKILNILGICMTLLAVTGLFLHFNVVHLFLTYLKIKRKQKPTNYEVSLLFIKNVFQIIHSGLDTVRNCW